MSRPLTRTPHRALAALLGLCTLLLGWSAVQPAQAGTQTVAIRATVKLVPGSGATLRYRGSFTGAPLGSGRVDVTSRMNAAGDVKVSFTLSNGKGSVSGDGRMTLDYDGNMVNVRGSANITRGTGAYARMRARGLRVSGRTPISSVSTAFNLNGRATS